jgi:hypothetical protein
VVLAKRLTGQVHIMILGGSHAGRLH